MAHDLEERNGRASMFYLDEDGAPWHNLGQKVDKTLTAREALVEARLNFKVSKAQLRFDNSVSYVGVPDKVANFRTDTGDYLGVVGNRYSILQNEDAFSFFDPLVDSNEAMYHTAGVLGKGEIVWILAKLPDYIEGGDGERVDEYVLIVNSHNGSKQLSAMFTPIRVVCNNTLNWAIKNTANKVTIRHSGDVKTKLEEAHKILGLSQNYFKKIEPMITNLSDVKVTDNDVVKMVKSIYPMEENSKKNNTRIINLRADLAGSIYTAVGQEVDHTLYWLLNGVVAHFDNEKNYSTDTIRLNNAWFNTKVKQDAFEVAGKMFEEKTGYSIYQN